MRTLFIIVLGFVVTLVCGFVLVGSTSLWPVWTAVVPVLILVTLFYPTPWAMGGVVWAAVLVEGVTHALGGVVMIPTLIAVLMWPVLQRRIDIVPLLFREAWSVGNVTFHAVTLAVLFGWYAIAESLIARFVWHYAMIMPAFSFTSFVILCVHIGVILACSFVLHLAIQRTDNLHYRL